MIWFGHIQKIQKYYTGKKRLQTQLLGKKSAGTAK